jgi:polyhydroxybutyrate depolymerase
LATCDYGRDVASRRRVPLAIGLVGGVLVAACGAAALSPSQAVRSPTPSRAESPAPIASRVPSGSLPTASPTTGVELLEPVIGVGDDRRRVRVFVPDALPAARVPLVLFLHASGETTATAVQDTRFDALAAREGFIAAFPPADGQRWAAQMTPGLSDSDVDERYLAGLVDELVRQLPIDPERIYVAGFSIGAVMAGRMACQHADRIAAAAIVAGAPWVGQPCRPSRPVSILLVHGTGDSTLRYTGAQQLADTWRDLDRCQPAGTPAPIASGASVTTTTGCAGGTSVAVVTVDRGTHTWFTTPDATMLAWDFFLEHGRQ